MRLANAGMTFVLTIMVWISLGGQVEAQEDSTALHGGWVILSEPRVDLWYHGLAVIGLNADEEFPLYNADYVERVRAAKMEMGIAPTPLDEQAEKLREELEKDPAFELFHFIPLYFPLTSRERMFQALFAVADRNTRDSAIAGRDTRAGMRLLEGRFREGKHRQWLREFIEVLEQEWNLFYRDFRRTTAAGDATYLAVMRRRWEAEVAPAIDEFLTTEQLDSGRAYVVPALGIDGRSFEGSSFQRTVHALAVWAPAWNDPRASLFSVVRELCYSVAGRSLQTAGGGMSSAELGSAAVQCGARLLGHVNPDLADEYRSIYVRALAADTLAGDVSTVFDESYEVAEAALDTLDLSLGLATGVLEPEDPPLTRWVVEAKPQVDLWYHVLAVAAADEPGPLGLYSADYARHVREAKQELGIYPTKLDSIASSLRRGVADAGPATFDLFHFLPLYFPRAEPEQMLEALRTVGRGRTLNGNIGGPGAVRFGMIVASQNITGSRERRVLRDLVDAAENEWEVFYRDYWEQMVEEQGPRYAAVQAVWDSLFAPQLAPYLTRRRLTGGLVIPSPPVGPEGRIVDGDEYVPTDQTVSVQVPLSTSSPDATVFAFLKELCFLLVDDNELGGGDLNQEALEDVRRRAAVRCGALILQFYAPTLVSSYRRTFLDAVGADEGYTVAAFERVYALDPAVFDRLREQLRHR